jgi:hypothetical protein
MLLSGIKVKVLLLSQEMIAGKELGFSTEIQRQVLILFEPSTKLTGVGQDIHVRHIINLWIPEGSQSGHGLVTIEAFELTDSLEIDFDMPKVKLTTSKIFALLISV